ncbi:MAG: hypothetical protein IKB11_02460 [Bacteroidaceae bacterium]|nr:hypothetical protein [Bacteroidaceae bacterium]
MESDILAKCEGLNTENKPNICEGLYTGTPSIETRLCELSQPYMCNPASYSALV